MSKWVAVRILLLIGALIAVAGGAAYWISRPPVPFDEAFQNCEEDEAAWRLIVTYSTDGLADQDEFIAYFQPREPSTNKTNTLSGSWFRWWEPSIIEWEEVGGPGMIAEFHSSLCFDTDGNWYCQSSMFATALNGTGVDLAIKQNKGGDEDIVVAETISLPFPKTTAGRKGKISYSARWEEVPDAES